jgi:hypothetical protein
MTERVGIEITGDASGLTRTLRESTAQLQQFGVVGAQGFAKLGEAERRLLALNEQVLQGMARINREATALAQSRGGPAVAQRERELTAALRDQVAQVQRLAGEHERLQRVRGGGSGGGGGFFEGYSQGGGGIPFGLANLGGLRGLSGAGVAGLGIGVGVGAAVAVGAAGFQQAAEAISVAREAAAAQRFLAASARNAGVAYGDAAAGAILLERDLALTRDQARRVQAQALRVASVVGRPQDAALLARSVGAAAAGSGLDTTDLSQYFTAILTGEDTQFEKLTGRSPSVLYSDAGRRQGRSAGSFSDQEKLMIRYNALIQEGARNMQLLSERTNSAIGQLDRLYNRFVGVTAVAGDAIATALGPAARGANYVADFASGVPYSEIAARSAGEVEANRRGFGGYLLNVAQVFTGRSGLSGDAYDMWNARRRFEIEAARSRAAVLGYAGGGLVGDVSVEEGAALAGLRGDPEAFQAQLNSIRAARAQRSAAEAAGLQAAGADSLASSIALQQSRLRAFKGLGADALGLGYGAAVDRNGLLGPAVSAARDLEALRLQAAALGPEYQGALAGPAALIGANAQRQYGQQLAGSIQSLGALRAARRTMLGQDFTGALSFNNATGRYGQRTSDLEVSGQFELPLYRFEQQRGVYGQITSDIVPVLDQEVAAARAQADDAVRISEEIRKRVSDAAADTSLLGAFAGINPRALDDQQRRLYAEASRREEERIIQNQEESAKAMATLAQFVKDLQTGGTAANDALKNALKLDIALNVTQPKNVSTGLFGNGTIKQGIR